MNASSWLSSGLCLLLGFFCACSPSESADKGKTFARLSLLDDPQTLDPRKMRDVGSISVAHLLYEALTRINSEGAVELAAAEDIEVSPDGRLYTIQLKNGKWSDGSPVLADDFVETWKSTLDPTFPAPNAYQLYVIEGAKEAKGGSHALNAIGIQTIAPKTLVITLKEPVPYFLELLSCPFFYPVHRSLREGTTGELAVSNGPFQLVQARARQEYLLEKNHHFRLAPFMKLAGVSIQVLSETTALQLFLAGELDWAGSPISTLPQDAIQTLKESKILKMAPAAATYWFRFNTSRAPFNHPSVRRAFALALDRQSIVNHVTQGNQVPALTVVPPLLGLTPQGNLQDGNVAEAKQQLGKGVEERGWTLPITVTLRCVANARSLKIAQAVQQQWQEALGVEVNIAASEFKTNIERMKAGDFEICLSDWVADIADPVNFLEIFKSKENPTNLTFWENATYAALLDKAALVKDPSERFDLLSQAETILLEELPVAPLMHPTFNYLQSDRLQGVYVSPLGYIDLVEAYLVP